MKTESRDQNPESREEEPKRSPRVWPCVCVDIETLATVPDAVVTEIAAVAFDPGSGELGPAFAVEVFSRGPDQALRVVDEATLGWWLERHDLHGQRIPGLHEGLPLGMALEWFCDFLDVAGIAPGAEMWAWGSDFDFPILASCFRDMGMALPWRYARQRDARTLCEALGVERVCAARHVAKEDAKVEAEAVMAALRLLESRVQNPESREEGEVGL